MKIKSKKTIGIGIAIIMVMGLIGAVIEKTDQSSPTTENAEIVETSQAPVQTKYRELSRKENKTVENIAVLINPNESAQMISSDIKSTCKKPCNIDVYDDQKAYDLYSQYDSMMGDISTNPEDLTKWKQENYVYVADHLVGSIDFETGSFTEYPFRDWYYKELKGEK